MPEVFKANGYNDEFEITYIKKLHKAVLKIKSIDNVDNHLKLINSLSEMLKGDDIKWVDISLDFEPIIPCNTVYRFDKVNKVFKCHIEDFEKFYLSNMKNLIKFNHVNTGTLNEANDGWITIVDHKKSKKDKFNKIKNDIDNIAT